MARSVASPIDVLESALQLLRQAPRGTLALHWIGAAPFALGLLRFWSDITNPRIPDSTCLLEAFALALLLVWMNAWRAAFAGRLHHQLAGSAEAAWPRGRVWRLIAGQGFCGATKMIVLPLAALILFPLSATVAFYRNASIVGGREDLDPTSMLRQARRLAARQPAQSWLFLPLLVFLALLVALNVATGVFLLPHLLKMLTGVESVYTRSGIYFLKNPLFGVMVLVVSWLAFDPFVQAVYGVLCFQTESAETGADVRATLRRIRTLSRTAAAVLLLLAAAGTSRAAVSKADLEKAAEQTMQAHDYDWRLPPDATGQHNPSWLVTATDRMLERVHSYARAIGRGLDRFFKWLGERLNSGKPQSGFGTPPTVGLSWTMWLIIGIASMAVLFMLWRIPWRNLRRRKTVAAQPVAVPIRLDSEDINAADLPEDRWLELAAECFQKGDLRLALRAFYLANLAWLGQREFLSIHPGKTNREYQAELRRRARGVTAAQQLFGDNIAAFERSWYGLHTVSADDLAEFRRRMEELKPVLAPPEAAA